MTKLLDSKTKLLVASKGTVQTLIQQNFGGAESDLEDVLSQPVDQDEV